MGSGWGRAGLEGLLASLQPSLDNDTNGTEEGEDNYSRKIEAPIYEPTGPKPPIKDLYATARTEQLLAEIDAAESA